MKKKFVTLCLAAALAVSTAACGSTESGEAVTETTVAETETAAADTLPAGLDLAGIYQAIIDLQTVPEDEITMLPEDAVELIEIVYPGLFDAGVKNEIYYAAPVTGYACEILLVEAKSADDIPAITAVMQTRIDHAKEDDTEGNAQDWERAQIQTRDAYAAMIVLPDGCTIPDDVFSLTPVSSESTDTDYTLEDVKTASDITSVLQKHECVVTTDQTMDENGNVLTTLKKQYSMGAAGLCTDSTRTLEDETYYAWDFIGVETPGVTCTQANDGSLYMDVYRSSEYQTFAASDWNTFGTADGETFVSCSEQDGAVIVQSRVDYRDVAESYDYNYYYIDPDSGDLLAVFTESLSTTDDSVLSTRQISIEYDNPYEPEIDPTNSILVGDGPTLTVHILENGAETETQTFTVASGTDVTFCSDENFTIYSDEACTNQLYLIGEILEDTTVYVSFES